MTTESTPTLFAAFLLNLDEDAAILTLVILKVSKSATQPLFLKRVLVLAVLPVREHYFSACMTGPSQSPQHERWWRFGQRAIVFVSILSLVPVATGVVDETMQ